MAWNNAAQLRRNRRRFRIRRSVKGTPERPRLTIYNSNKYIYLQIIDDIKGATLAASDSRKFGEKKREAIEAVVSDLFDKAQKKGVKQVVFDRNGYLYHGLVKEVSKIASKKGLTH